MSGGVNEQIDEHCRRLRLRSMAEGLKSIEETEPREFLLRFLQMQTESRDRTRIDRAVRAAGFYTLKSFEDFRFDEVKLPAAITPEELKTLRFLDECILSRRIPGFRRLAFPEKTVGNSRVLP